MPTELVRHLHSAFGQVMDRPLTVAALTEELESYESGAEPEQLASRLQAMGQQVALAASQTAVELHSCGPAMGHLLQQQLEGYEGLEVWLRRGRRRVEEGHSVEDVIENLVQLREQIRRASEALAGLFAQAEWRCPSCGEEGLCQRCPECGVEVLLWDELPDEEEDATLVAAGPRAEDLYCMVTAILEGRASLSDLAQPVAANLADLRRLSLSGELGRALGQFEEGMEWLAQALESRRTSHLLQGWRDCYRGLVALQWVSQEQVNEFTQLAKAS